MTRDDRTAAQAEEALDQSKSVHAQLAFDSVYAQLTFEDAMAADNPRNGVLGILSNSMTTYLTAAWGMGRQQLSHEEHREAFAEVHRNLRNWILCWRTGDLPDMDDTFTLMMLPVLSEMDDPESVVGTLFQHHLKEEEASSLLMTYVDSAYKVMRSGQTLYDAAMKKPPEIPPEVEDTEEDAEADVSTDA